MKVKDKEKLHNPLKGWRILSAISSIVFHTVQCSCFGGLSLSLRSHDHCTDHIFPLQFPDHIFPRQFSCLDSGVILHRQQLQRKPVKIYIPLIGDTTTTTTTTTSNRSSTLNTVHFTVLYIKYPKIQVLSLKKSMTQPGNQPVTLLKSCNRF